MPSYSAPHLRNANRKYSRGAKSKSLRRDSVKGENFQGYGRHYEYYQQQNTSGQPEYSKRKMPSTASLDERLEPFPDFKENYPAVPPPARSTGDMIGSNFLGDNVNDVCEIWVGSIPPHITPQMVEQVFAGKIPSASAERMMPEKDATTNFCFVTFNTTNDVRQALNMDGAVIEENWRLLIRIPTKYVNHGDDYDPRPRHQKLDQERYRSGRRSTAGSHRPSSVRRGSYRRQAVERGDNKLGEVPSGTQPYDEKLRSYLSRSQFTDCYYRAAGEDFSSAPAPELSPAGASDVTEGSEDRVEPKYYTPHTPENSAAGQFRSNSVLPRIETSNLPPLCVIGRPSSNSEGAPPGFPPFPKSDSNIEPKAQEAEPRTKPEQAKLGSDGEQSKPASTQAQKRKKKPKPLVLNKEKDPQLPPVDRSKPRQPDVEQEKPQVAPEQEPIAKPSEPEEPIVKPSEQENPVNQPSEQPEPTDKPGWVTPTAKGRAQDMDRSSSASPTVYTTPPETKDGLATEAAASFNTERRECNDEGATKADKQSSPPRPKDDWVHPFARQKAIEKQQKQAAKNQKKKEKKGRQTSKGVPGSKQKLDEKSDVETTEGGKARDGKQAHHAGSGMTEGESKTRHSTLKQAPEAGSDTPEGTHKSPSLPPTQGQLGSATAVQSANVSNSKAGANDSKVSGEENNPQEASRAETGVGKAELLKSTKKKPEKRSVQEETLPPPQVTVEQKTEKAKTTDKPTSQGKGACIDDEKPSPKKSEKSKQQLCSGEPDGQAAVEHDDAPRAESHPPKEVFRPLFEYEPPRTIDFGGTYKSRAFCHTSILMRGQSITPEEVYPQSLRYNSVGFPLKNLMVRDTNTVTSHVPKMMRQHEEQEMARTHYCMPSDDHVPESTHIGSMAISYKKTTCIGARLGNRDARPNDEDTPPRTPQIGAPPNTPVDGSAKYDEYDDSYTQLLASFQKRNPMLQFRNMNKPRGDEPDAQDFRDWDRTSTQGNLDYMRGIYANRDAGREKDGSDDGADAPKGIECSACFAPNMEIRKWMFCKKCAATCEAGCRHSRENPAWKVDENDFVPGFCVQCKKLRVRDNTDVTSTRAAAPGDQARA
jgi:hypothetical protein